MASRYVVLAFFYFFLLMSFDRKTASSRKDSSTAPVSETGAYSFREEVPADAGAGDGTGVSPATPPKGGRPARASKTQVN